MLVLCEAEGGCDNDATIAIPCWVCSCLGAEGGEQVDPALADGRREQDLGDVRRERPHVNEEAVGLGGRND